MGGLCHAGHHVAEMTGGVALLTLQMDAVTAAKDRNPTTGDGNRVQTQALSP